MNYGKTLAITNARCYDPLSGEYELCDIFVSDGVIQEKAAWGRSGSWQADEYVDLSGLWLYPGMIDAHCHLIGIGQKMRSVDLELCESLDSMHSAILQSLQALGSQSGPLLFRGWDEVRLGQSPTRAFLDTISRDHAIICVRRCGHIAVLSSKAVECFGLVDVDGESGSSLDTGTLREQDWMTVARQISRSGEIISGFWREASLALRDRGVTCVHSDDLGNADWKSLFRLLRDQQDIRVFEKLQPPSQTPVDHWAIGSQNPFGKISLFSETGAIKLFLDGSLGGRTAYLQKPYQDDPSTCGVLLIGEEDFGRLVELAERAGVMICVHVIGDGSLEIALDGFARHASSGNPLRHRLIHAQLATQDQVKRIRNLGLHVSIQPSFFVSDQPMSRLRLGQGRLEEIGYPFDRMLQAGIPVSLSTDAPVEDYCPWKTLREALRFMNIRQAIEAYTVQAARAGFQEDHIGIWEVGHYADGFALEDDLSALNQRQIGEINPIGTFFHGVWHKKEKYKSGD